MELNPVKIPTKAMTLCRPRDPVARWAGSSAEPAAETSPGRRSHATETESGREESGQRLRAAGGEAERVRAAARKPARPKRRQATEKAGEESNRRSAPARREEGVEEAKKTFGELGMAAGGPAGRSSSPARDAGTGAETAALVGSELGELGSWGRRSGRAGGEGRWPRPFGSPVGRAEPSRGAPVGETPGFSFAAGTKRSMAHVPDRIGLLVLGSCC